ncbi:BON domain-containing protein [Enterovirga aerilata]|uniref:BON domain-containing protein n=1 Tax=Enterovirga aerilata TaxID=2730920 RepID=A0A849I723_9HYPH|nr:BON domain-containing protein [Enterovirga sp. DB1703]NNM73534.1 BON domain-containing protein [Enterovirga sp. DB1703]
MAGSGRWGDERERHRGHGGRERGRDDWDRGGPDPDRFSRYDRESFARGEGLGRGSRYYPGGHDYYSYGRDRDSMGRRDEPGRDWDSDYRSGYGRGHGGSPSGGRREDTWGAGRVSYRGGGRSVGEMAFGRDQSGRDDPGDFGRARERGWLDRAGETVASWFGGEDDEERIRRLDLRDRAGEHRGRGPKSYQRSDERILEDVNDRLTDDPHLDASDIEVSVSGREVTLTGTVANRFDKRRAEDLADSVSGVIHVQNNLRVRASAGAAGWSDERISGGADVAGMGRTDKTTV